MSDSHPREGQAHLNVQPEISLTEPDLPPRLSSQDEAAGQGQKKIQSSEEKDHSEQIKTDLASTVPVSPDTSRSGGQDEATGPANSPGDIPATSTGEINTQTQAPTSGDASSTVRHPVESNGQEKENQNAQLDIKELRAIADLAKRLQGGGQQKA